jgi:hypothetical protein
MGIHISACCSTNVFCFLLCVFLHVRYILREYDCHVFKPNSGAALSEGDVEPDSDAETSDELLEEDMRRLLAIFHCEL